jgi:hypothetical protein
LSRPVTGRLASAAVTFTANPCRRLNYMLRPAAGMQQRFSLRRTGFGAGSNVLCPYAGLGSIPEGIFKANTLSVKAFMPATPCCAKTQTD